MDEPTRAKARTVYHSANLVEAETAEAMEEAKLDLVSQLARLQPADQQDEAMLALISNLIHMGKGE